MLIFFEYPYTLAPNVFNIEHNQIPLNPVWPVIKTLLFLKKIFHKKLLIIYIYIYLLYSII